MKTLTSIVIVLLFCSCGPELIHHPKEIKEFKFYGFENPSKNSDAIFIPADTEKINQLFANLEPSDPYFPKGASRYATITFIDNKTITIQIIPGGNVRFRIVEKGVLKDKWYQLNSSTSKEWYNYLEVLQKSSKDQAPVDDDTEEVEDDCIFDVATQTPEFLDGIDQLKNYTWDDNSKTATIPLDNGDTVEITRGGCAHYSFYISLRSPSDTTALSNTAHWISKLKNITMLFEADFENETIYSLLSDGQYDLDSTANQHYYVLLQDQYCDMTFRIQRIPGGGALVEVGYYIC